jgi:transcription antitermination factor NusG
MPILAKEPALYPNTLLTGYLDSFEGVTDEPELATYDETEQRVWWCVFTRSRQEKKLARMLYGHEVPFYLPLVPHHHLYRGRKVKSYMPLFSGYMFLFADEEERITALTTNCISRMLPVDDKAQLIHDLLNIHNLIAAEAPITVEQRLRPGRRVRVKSGVMEGTEGVVIERRGQSRLFVAVNFLNQGVSVDIEDFMVEPL